VLFLFKHSLALGTTNWSKRKRQTFSSHSEGYLTVASKLASFSCAGGCRKLVTILLLIY